MMLATCQWQLNGSVAVFCQTRIVGLKVESLKKGLSCGECKSTTQEGVRFRASAFSIEEWIASYQDAPLRH
jgi:hypothetical protein